jgi:hypothetical protein
VSEECTASIFGAKIMLNKQKEKNKQQVKKIMYEKLVMHKPV